MTDEAKPYPKAHEHEWNRVPPVVTTVGDPFGEEKGHQTYNAECIRCGKRAWLHWPEPRYGRSA